jgi:E2F transcription factor CC-MB domain
MRNDLDELKENEQQLDNLIEKIKTISKRQNDCKYAYVMSQDLHSIDMYNDQMIMVVKAPPESQLILMDGDPPPIVLKSEKDEINVFFCPDPSVGGMQAAMSSLESTDSDDEEASSSVRKHRKTASTSASANKRRNLGSAQRNLSKAFEEMIEPKSAKSKSNLFKVFNAVVCRESSDEGLNTNEDTEDDDEGMSSTKAFKSTTITTKDLMLLNEPSSDDLEPSYGIKKDVKLSLFSPQKNLQESGTSHWTEIHDAMPNFSPSYTFPHSDDPATSFFPLEPDAEYNFQLADTEGIMDLFDY